MRFADDVLQLYLQHFNNNEHDDSLELFVQSILEQMDHNDLLQLVQRCNKEELNKILTNYLREDIEVKLKNTSSTTEDSDGNMTWKKVQ
ncbi:hypothetical protein GH741_19235 [Aquibacillus halophilus]|uniref:Uncharacterized protein n=1 Tax=Aquibacillus halophilus TaxID=930132 RepID=A0A6A8DP01_9BACI|nr:DUF6154 family protein [Aquibacillus halophilus]MRH44787.1 hypothetical protein [Aquibacillus halophilus]